MKFPHSEMDESSPRRHGFAKPPIHFRGVDISSIRVYRRHAAQRSKLDFPQAAAGFQRFSLSSSC